MGRVKGVYVVALDPSIAGPQNVSWCLTDEFDADAVVAALCEVNGPGSAWHTYEPVARSLDDRDLREYLSDRGVTGHTLERLAKC